MLPTGLPCLLFIAAYYISDELKLLIRETIKYCFALQAMLLVKSLDSQMEAGVCSVSCSPWAGRESPFVILPDGAPSIIDTSHTALHAVITSNCWPLIGRPAAGCDWSNITGSREWGDGDTCTHMDIETEFLAQANRRSA